MQARWRAKFRALKRFFRARVNFTVIHMILNWARGSPGSGTIPKLAHARRLRVLLA